MTYERLKSLTKGYLIGDNVLPEDEDVVLALLQSALMAVAHQADSLHLMTLSTTADVLRLAQGDYLIRMPELPVVITTAIDALVGGETEQEIATATATDLAATKAQLIDIDEELTFAVARYMASYISREKGGIHVNAATRIILDYNCKTWEITEQMQVEAAAAGVADVCATAVSTEFTL